MKCIIIEDQAPAQRILKKYISDTSALELVAIFNNALEAIPFLKEHSIDLVFLDIHLPKLSGIEFLRSIQAPPKIILTTAFTEYALESYEYDVVDYLLKPFSFSRFIKAVNKALGQEKATTKELAVQNESLDHVIIKTGHEYTRIKLEEILYIQSEYDYTELFTPDKTYLSNKTLKSWLEQLSPQFVQVHRSFIVNKDKVESLTPNALRVNQNKEVPVGRAFKEKLKEALGWQS